MSRVRVHITLEDRIKTDAAAREKLLRQLEESAGMTEINLPRFERYGLLSGLVDKKQLDGLKALSGIRSVELDQMKRPK